MKLYQYCVSSLFPLPQSGQEISYCRFKGSRTKIMGTIELIVPFIAQFVVFHNFRRHLRSILLLSWRFICRNFILQEMWWNDTVFVHNNIKDIIFPAWLSLHKDVWMVVFLSVSGCYSKQNTLKSICRFPSIYPTQRIKIQNTLL